MFNVKEAVPVYDEDGESVALIDIKERNGFSLDSLSENEWLRPFSIVKGGRSLRRRWYKWSTLFIRTNDGQNQKIRLAAFPTDRGGSGLIQFI